MEKMETLKVKAMLVMLTHAVLHREVPRPNSFCSFLLQSELPNQVRRSVLPSGVFAQEITADAWVPLTDFLLSPQLVGHKCLSSGQVFLRFFWFSDLQFFQIFFSFFSNLLQVFLQIFSNFFGAPGFLQLLKLFFRLYARARSSEE